MHATRLIGLTCLTFGLLSCCLVALRAQNPSANPVAAVDKYFEPFKTCTYRAEWITTVRGINLPPDTVTETSGLEVWHDEDKWRVVLTSKSTYFDPKKKEAVTTPYGSEWVNQKVGSVMVGIDPVRSAGDGMIARLGPVPEPDQNYISAFPIGALHGAFGTAGFTNLPTLFHATAPKADFEGPLRVFQGSSSWGYTLARFDPARGFAWTYVESKKTDQDWYLQDKTIGSLKGGGLHRPRSNYRNMDRTYAVNEWAKAGDVHYPASFTRVEAERFANGQTVRLESKVRVSDLKVGKGAVPPESFRVGTPIADGTLVNVEDSENISYEWRQGQIVKQVDGTVVASMEGWKFEAPSGRRNYWWPALIAIAAVVLLTAAVWYFRRARRAAILK